MLPLVLGGALPRPSRAQFVPASHRRPTSRFSALKGASDFTPLAVLPWRYPVTNPNLRSQSLRSPRITSAGDLRVRGRRSRR